MRTPNPRKTAIYPIIPIAFQWAFPGAFEARGMNSRARFSRL